MDPIAVTAASGLRARMQTLDLLANNLANIGTGGYKSDREFYSLFKGDAEDPSDTGLSSSLPDLNQHWTDFAQGQLTPTGNPLDFGLNGNGFFAVNGPSGALYTRNGSFHLDSKGVLVTADNYVVRSTTGAPIKAEPGISFEVTREGAVSQNGVQLGQMAVMEFKDKSVLAKSGGNYFKPTDAKVTPAQSIDTTVQQGQIESSNVVPAESTVRIVGIMRQFEMLQKAITLASEMSKSAIEQVAKVG